MKLFTHNILRCNKKGVKEGYPLKIEATEVKVKKIEFNPDFVKNIMTRTDYDALRQAASALKCPELPEKLDKDMMEDEKILRLLHHVLLECVVMEGHLVCPESGRKFPISKGIPNMLLDEDEV